MIKCDLLVIGGGTAGCACAYTAAKAGLSVILIEKSIVLGGTMTSALVIPVMKSGENQINTDFYTDLISQMKTFGGQIDFQNNPGWFNPEILKIALDKMLKSVGVKILFNSEIKKVKFSSSKVEHAEIYTKTLLPCVGTIHNNNISANKNDILSECIEAKYYVDATGNANFCKKINCEILDDSENFQPMSLRFIMSGVDLERFGNFLAETDTDRKAAPVESIQGVTHLSAAYTWDTDKHWSLAPLFDDAISNNILKPSDSNYFQVFSVAGTPDSVAFNCPRILEKPDYTDIYCDSDIIIKARESVYRIAEFCKKYFPGFEKAQISNIADMVGVRVSDRIRGKYIYTSEDLRTGKKFEHPVVISDYPIDIHNSNKNSSTLDFTGEYQLPIESLMAKDYDNVFVAGRCLSADFEAQAALRVQASCFSMGEGVAKYIKNLIK